MAQQNSRSSLHPLLKGLLYVLGTFLLLLIVGQLLIAIFADDYVGDYLKDRVRTSSDNVYSLNFDDLDLNLFSGSASINNLQLTADTTAFSQTTSPQPKPPQTLIKGTVGEVEISGINLLAATLGKKLSIGRISIRRPHLTFIRNPRKIQADSSRFSSLDSTIYAAISGRYQSLEIDEVTLYNGTTLLIESSDTLSVLHDLNLNLNDIEIDSSSAHSGRLFLTDDFSFETGELRMQSSNKLNTYTLDRLSVSSEDQSVAVDSLLIKPRYPKLVFSRQLGHQKDRIDLTVPEIRIHGIDFEKLVDSTQFYAQKAEINQARFEDFLYKSLPDPKEKKPLPFITFRDLDQPIKIDTLRINNSFISYSEYINKVPQAGTVTFEELNASFYNISNYPEDIASGLTTTLDIQTRAFGAGLLTLHMEFPMDTQNGFHSIKGNLSRMSLSQFNKMMKYVAFVQFDEGTVHSLEFDMRLNRDRSNGDLIMDYENMKISILDATTMEQEGILANIKTFIANKFVIDENEAPNEVTKAGRVSFERIEQKSIFNYWWKSLLSGIKDAVK